MRVEITREPKLAKVDHLYVLLAEGDEGQRKIAAGEVETIVSSAVKRAGFTGRADESITLLFETGPRKLTLQGLGKLSALNPRSVRAAILTLGKTARRNRDRSIAVLVPYTLPPLNEEETTRLVADLLSHADYKYSNYITKKEDNEPIAITCTLIPMPAVDAKAAKRISAQASALSSSVLTVRDLGNGPGNEVTPTRLAERAAEVAKSVGVKCTIYDRKQITAMKMGGLLAVNQGSAQEPRFIVLEYAPKKPRKKIALVGKGITFDSGGISIKPSDRMEEMKFDMCGAAAVIGIVQAAAELELPHHIYGVIPSTENLPSGSAYKPGDIIRMMSGKTVEIVNTDAEGRMILADALHYASNLQPDHIIDYATLTGACVVALGSEATGLFSNDDELARKLIESGSRVGERLWRLPEWDDYKDYFKSDWADMKNSGGRSAGATSAALFLKEFVNCPSWAHLDIAGTAWSENESSKEAKGATGVGVRATIDFLESLR